jgi:acyl-CoA reductase-like NAD-dependent aldehyde dehydrogenase
MDNDMVFINNIHRLDAELPFSGIKHSGYGCKPGNPNIFQHQRMP